MQFLKKYWSNSLKKFSVLCFSCIIISCETGTEVTIPPDTEKVYASVQAVDMSDNISGFSAEISKTYEPDNEGFRITWNLPTEEIDGDCIMTPFKNFIINFGIVSGEYIKTKTISATSKKLDCSNIGVSCSGNLVQCEIELQPPGF